MKIVAALLAFLLPLAALPSGTQQLPDIPTIQVPAGGATVSGQIAANGRNVYYVSANSLISVDIKGGPANTR